MSREEPLPAPGKASCESSEEILWNMNTTFEAQLESLISRITPEADCRSKYNSLCSDVHEAVRKAYPSCIVLPFGSTFTGLALKESDVDIYIDINHQPSKYAHPMKIIKSQIYRSQYNFENIIFISAKTPIVKLSHKKTGLKCDISCKNGLGVKNSYLIKYFVSLDPRIKPFLILIKYWAKFFGLTGSNRISNYALTLKALFYLQQMENPLIPSVTYLQSLCHNKQVIDGWECSIMSVPPQNVAPSDTRTVADLLSGFFHYYATFDYKNKVICLLLGRTVPKSVFADTTQIPIEMATYVQNCLTDDDKLQVDSKSGSVGCVQDPFVLNHNVVQHVGTSFMEKLVPSYIRCAQICDEVSDKAQLLSELFHERNRIVPPSSTLLLNLISSNVIGFPHYFEKIGKSVDQYFLDTYYFVIMILTRVFGMEVKIDLTDSDDTDHPRPSKMRKLELDSSVVVPSFESLKPIELHCSGSYDVTQGRINIKKKLQTPVENQLKMELLVTEQILANARKQNATTQIEICCRFTPQLKPLQVGLEISDIASRKKIFKNWSQSLRDRMFKLYNLHFQEYKVASTNSTT